MALTREQAEFMVKNCDQNIAYALQMSMKFHGENDSQYDDLLTKLIQNMEEFKELKKAVAKGLADG